MATERLNDVWLVGTIRWKGCGELLLQDNCFYKVIAVSQAFIFHFMCYSILHFVVCQLLCWAFLLFIVPWTLCLYHVYCMKFLYIIMMYNCILLNIISHVLLFTIIKERRVRKIINVPNLLHLHHFIYNIKYTWIRYLYCL